MREPTIAVTGVSPVQPGLPVMRAIRDAGYAGRFIGLSYTPLDPIHYEPDLVERCYLIPHPAQGAAHLLDRLLEVHSDGKIDVLIPTLDAELPVLRKLAPRLEAEGIHMLLPTAQQLEIRGKAKLAAWAAEAGILTPTTRVAHSAEAAHRLAYDLRYPFFLKGQYYGAARVSDAAGFHAALDMTVRSWGYPVIMQEAIFGTEYDVIILGGRTGELLGAVPMKKLQLDGSNKAWGGVTVADPAIGQVVARAMDSLRWRGIFELELMRGTRDGQYYLLEVNPRVPAWVRLTVAAGQNMPWALVKLALGEDVPPFPDYVSGAMTLRQTYDVVSPMSIYEALSLTGKIDHRLQREGAAIALERQPTPGLAPAPGPGPGPGKES
jgi:carbamoyl-phosphate synthase large subunit